ncbi:long-chain fatty acid--CoA ligase [Nocardiopsis sp. MG754419]|uniref:AMP-dependent synthetase/ligase n=1 Tax=Nocardiopsis sp. MG754419 TaxID=2259865 RepID=UPI001BA56B2B|nr:AMP-dependent synthetase/ligase [Nocardiopsis sp. MG754419]MBR8745263.1 long-chain fatty acid--CoA ligase [Nocardiopsis sp. MG754419]
MTSVPGTADDPTNRTLPDLLLRNAREFPDRPALSWREPGATDWTTLTWARTHDTVAALAEGYAALGVRPGDHALIMMGNRPEHWLSDLALVHAGAVPGTVYTTSAPEQVAHIARHSRARVAVVENAETAARWEPLLKDPDTPLAHLVVVEGADPERGHTPYTALTEAVPAGAFDRWRALTPDDLVTVVYTSGTTGDPKGVAISHRRVLAQTGALERALEVPAHPSHVCYLPLAHIAERLLGIYLPLVRGSHVWMCADPTAMVGVLPQARPVHFLGVPRVWEKLAGAVHAMLSTLPEERRAVVDAAREIATEYAAHLERAGDIPADLEERYRRARATTLDPLLARLGLDRVALPTSASAPMPVDVARFWASLGVIIMDAWGLTESVGVATMNRPGPGDFRIGSVGRPIDGIEVRLAEDGEVFLRGDSLFQGYLGADGSIRPDLDADGWFATGDVGRIDEDGFLWITDRKKELIVTSGGKNVSPALVENTLKEHPLIGQAFAHGDRRPYLVALIVLDPELTPLWAASQGIDAEGAHLAEHPEVLAEIQRAVEAANHRLNRPEQVKRYRVLSGEWGPETGELTPSLKLRRRVVADRHARDLDALYQD